MNVLKIRKHIGIFTLVLTICMQVNNGSAIGLKQLIGRFKDGESKLHQAAQNKSLAEVSLCFEKHPDLLEKGNKGNETPLFYAPLNEEFGFEITLFFLCKNANVNAKNSTGGTALINAVLAKKPEIVRLLIAAGADVNGCTLITKYTALHFATWLSGKDEIITSLLTAGANTEAINMSLEKPNLEWYNRILREKETTLEKVIQEEKEEIEKMRKQMKSLMEEQAE